MVASSRTVEMNLVRVDAADDEQFAAWFDVLHRSELERDRGRDEGWLAQERRARALDETAPLYHQLFVFGDDPLHPLAIAVLEISSLDNLDWIRGELFVDPSHRHHGYGSLALRRLEKRARALRRQSLLFWVVEAPEEHGAGPNRRFCPRHGYEVIEENVVRHFEWPRPGNDLEQKWSEWARHAKDYEILSWRNNSPEEFLSGRARLMAVMPIEVPDSGIGYEEERWDEERVRHHEAQFHEMGRDLLIAVARHVPTGELVGFSEMALSTQRPEIAYQQDTLVVRAHRGHRLGGLMKIATMGLLEAGGYSTKIIMTSNNSVNAPMTAVNEALGARPAGGIVTWRKAL
jgi:GNAT superfamily N-acetyltransferase